VLLNPGGQNTSNTFLLKQWMPKSKTSCVLALLTTIILAVAAYLVK